MPSETGAEGGEDLSALVRSAREIASFIRDAAEGEAASVRASAVERAARVLEAAQEEREKATAARAAADDELATARSLRAAVEWELGRLAAMATPAPGARGRESSDPSAVSEPGSARAHARDVIDRTRSDARPENEDRTHLGTRLDDLRAAGGQQLAGEVRRLEDELEATLGEIEQELRQAGSLSRTAVGSAEQRAGHLAGRLADGARPEADG